MQPFRVVYLERDTERRQVLAELAARTHIPLDLSVPGVARPDHPARGCLLSHRQLIQRAQLVRAPYVTILEDDATWTDDDATRVMSVLTALDAFEWHMLYLGGNVMSTLADTTTTSTLPVPDNEVWERAIVLTTHAYLLHASQFDTVLADLDKIESGEWPDMTIDQYYTCFVHPKGKSFLLRGAPIRQRAGYSTIERQLVDYSLVLEPQPAIRAAADDTPPPLVWPGVTIVTPTRKRAAFLRFFLLPAILAQDYPREQLEWLIIDEHGHGEPEPVRVVDTNVLRDPPLLIRHVILEKENGSPDITIAQKRNLGAKLARHDLIVHMDDDDYYPPTSVRTRVQALADAACVGCAELLSYDIYREQSSRRVQSTLFEATMAYRRSFWEEQPFEARLSRGEGLSLLFRRHPLCVQLHPEKVIVSIVHAANVTGSLRRDDDDRTRGDAAALLCWDMIPTAAQHFLHTLRMVHLCS